MFSGFGHEGGRRTLRSSMFYCKIVFVNKERLMEEEEKVRHAKMKAEEELGQCEKWVALYIAGQW